LSKFITLGSVNKEKEKKKERTLPY
jgi:hypothetical protein